MMTKKPFGAFLLLGLALSFTAGTANAAHLPEWSLRSIEGSPCTVWQPNGKCQNWYVYEQHFADYEGTLNVLQLYTGALNELGGRVAELQRKAGLPPVLVTTPQWTLDSIKGSYCTVWYSTGICRSWDAYEQHVPDHSGLLAVLQLLTGAVNALDTQVAALDQNTPAPVPQWTIAGVKGSPCTLWRPTGVCQSWYSNERLIPDHDGSLAVFRLYANAIDGLDDRISALERH